MFPPSAGKTQMPSSGGSDAVVAFRRSLGVPTDQPAPEAKVIDAMSGKLGPDVQRMAQGIGTAAASSVAGAATPGTVAAPGGAVPAGNGQSTTPIRNGESTPKVPMNTTGSGTSGGAMFSGRPGATGTPVDDEDEDDDRSGAAMFGGRR